MSVESLIEEVAALDKAEKARFYELLIKQRQAEEAEFSPRAERLLKQMDRTEKWYSMEDLDKHISTLKD